MKILLVDVNKNSDFKKIYNLANSYDIDNIVINSHHLLNNSILDLIKLVPKDNINTYLMLDNLDNRYLLVDDCLKFNKERKNVEIINDCFIDLGSLIIYNEIEEEYLLNEDKNKIFMKKGPFKCELIDNNLFVSLDGCFLLVDYDKKIKTSFKIDGGGTHEEK